MRDAMDHYLCRMILDVGSQERRNLWELGVPVVRIVVRSPICSHWMCHHSLNHALNCLRSCTGLFANRVELGMLIVCRWIEFRGS
jgi:hypothetical protein